MIKPLFNYVVIKPTKAKEISDGGIILPETAQEKPQTGEIVAVGEGIYEFGVFITPKVVNGNIVIFPKHLGHIWEIDKTEYLIIRESELLGILTKGE